MLRKLYANPSAIILIMVAITTMGLRLFFELPISLYPQTSKPLLETRVGYGTTSAEDFKDRFGEKIETALLNLEGAEKVMADYRNGNARIETEFAWGTDPDEAKVAAKGALEGIRAEFPKGWGRFRSYYRGTGSRVMMSLRSPNMSVEALQNVVKKAILPHIERLPGADNAWLWEVFERVVAVEVRADALARLGFNMKDVERGLAAHEYNVSLGELDLGGGGVLQVQGLKKAVTIDDLKQIPIGTVQGVQITLDDLADVHLKASDPEVIVKGNGIRQVLIGGSPKPDANLKEFSETFIATVKERMAEIDPEMTGDVLTNPATFINEATANVILAVILGMVIASVVVFLFLGSLRNTLVVTVAIPFSLIAGFIVMTVLGIGINLISLGAMALAVGMVVDGAVVVLENIVRHLEMGKVRSKQEKLDRVVRATKEVAQPVIASLLTTIIVFAPLPFTSPLASAILGDLAIVMVCVMTISILVTLLVIPALMLLVGAEDPARKRGLYLLSCSFSGAMNRMASLYQITLARLCQYKSLRRGLYVFVLGLLALSGYVMTFELEREILGLPDTDKLILNVDFKEEYPIAEADRRATAIEKRMWDHFGHYVAFSFTEVSKDSVFILANLADKSQVTEAKKAFEDHFENTPDEHYWIGTWAPTSLRVPDPPLVEVSIAGADDEIRRNMLESLRRSLSDVEDLGRKENEPSTRKVDFLRVEPDVERLSRIRRMEPARGLSEEDIFQTLALFTSARVLGSLRLDGDDYDVTLGTQKPEHRSIETLRYIPIRVGDDFLPLKALGKVKNERLYSDYYSENNHDVNRFQVWPKESFKGARKDLRAQVMSTIRNDPDIDQSLLSFVDTDVEINENILSLIQALALALILISIVVTIQFGGLMRTAIIMLAIPLGFIGVSFALWAFGNPVNVNSLLGLILLCGTAVNNSIIFLDFYLINRKSMAVDKAISETARIRFRPIMITTLTTILGMVPVASGMGSGGEILQPLGVAICGGLMVSTLLTLVVVPMAIRFYERGLRPKGASAVGVALTLLAILTFGNPGGNRVFAQGLSLEAAEKLALANHSDIKIGALAVELESAQKRAVFARLLPKLAVERRWTETTYEDATLNRGDKAVNILAIEEDLSNPFDLHLETKSHSNARTIAAVELEKIRATILYLVRTGYFAVEASRLSLANTRRNLATAQDNLAIAKKRHQMGLIQVSEVLRTELTARRLEGESEEKASALELARMSLARLLGAKSLTPQSLELTDELPGQFSFFETGLEAAEDEKSYDVTLLHLREAEAQIAYERARARMFPDLTLRWEKTLQRPDHEVSPGSQESWLIGLKWTIFQGGGRYYPYVSSGYQREMASLALKKSIQDNRLELERLRRRLAGLKARYDLAQANQGTSEQIYHSSLAGFRRGLVSARQVNEDFSGFLREEEQVLLLKQEIIELLAKYAMIRGEPTLFQRML